MNKIPNNIKCVICHKDISDELPKVDAYENYYCKSCYEKKYAIEIVKSQAVKQSVREFAERLKERLAQKQVYANSGKTQVIQIDMTTNRIINELVKEVCGE